MPWSLTEYNLCQLSVSILHLPVAVKKKMTKETVILAYSGGLDTSCILHWLLEHNYNVVCYMADVGQDEDLIGAKEKALKIGAMDVVIRDLKQVFVEDYIWPAIKMGLIYEGRYLLGTSLARPCITVALIEVARDYNAKYISHGATGKGNDQVRFEMAAYTLMPSIRVIAPWRLPDFCNQFQGRVDLLDYAEKNNIPVTATPTSPWSMDANLMHVSYESGVLENPGTIAPLDLYQMTKNSNEWPEEATQLEIHFVRGRPEKVVDVATKLVVIDPLMMLGYLNEVGGQHGVGRIDIVENRFVGLKSRGIYESPGATILYVAHQDLELLTMDREVLRISAYLRERASEMVYNGFWFSPEANYTRRCLEMGQENVTGHVLIELYKGVARPLARYAPKSLYNQTLVSMDTHGAFNSTSAAGFIDIQAIRAREHYRVFGGDTVE